MKSRKVIPILALLFLLSGCGIRKEIEQSNKNAESFFEEKSSKAEAERQVNQEQVSHAIEQENAAARKARETTLNVNINEYIATIKQTDDIKIDKTQDTDGVEYTLTYPGNKIKEILIANKDDIVVSYYLYVKDARKIKEGTKITNFKRACAVVGYFLERGQLIDRPLYLVADITTDKKYNNVPLSENKSLIISEIVDDSNNKGQDEFQFSVQGTYSTNKE